MVPAALVVLTACSTALGKDIVGEAWSARVRLHVCPAVARCDPWNEVDDAVTSDR
jgi:hypothetical protein